jgi:hypothetical protein
MCERYTELVSAYQNNVALFNKAIEAMEAARPNSAKPEYERMVKYAEQAHEKMEQAGDELKVHSAAHNCVQSIRMAEA